MQKEVNIICAALNMSNLSLNNVLMTNFLMENMMANVEEFFPAFYWVKIHQDLVKILIKALPC